jgi:CRISPR/Cas system-associated exonuclease Cas4 (RecB family)
MWLKFRWAVIEKFEGRILRLFRRGQNEEQTVVDDLKSIGIDVRSTGVNQVRVNFGSHVSGSVDGIIWAGVPEAPNKKHILEIKTHSQKSFDDVCKHGVQKSKPEHYAQMQGYMFGLDIDRALYVAVCKNDDQIYTERVKLDKAFAGKMVERAKMIATMDTIPAPMSTDSTWYQCKFCSCHDFCFGSKKTKEVNCRTCAHSTAKADSTWHCAKFDASIPTDYQYKGCDSHVIHPDLVPWKLISSRNTETVACYEVDGKQWLNGEGKTPSTEMLNDNFFDKDVQLVRDIFGGEVIS